MSRLQEQAKNMGVTEDQYREYKLSGLSEDKYKKLIKDSEDTILTEEQYKELRAIVDDDDEYTIYDYMKDKNFTIPGLEEKDEVKFEQLLDQITPIEIIERKEEAEAPKKEYDRVSIKMEKELYDKIIYAAYCYNKEITAFVTELLAKNLANVEVDQELVDKIRANNKKKRASRKGASAESK